MTPFFSLILSLLLLAPSIASAATNVCMRFPSGTPVNCVDSSSGGGSGNVGIGTTGRIPVYIGTTTIGSPYNNVMDSSGNVGINTASPGTALDVSGTLRITGFQLTTNPSSRFVLTSNSVGVGTWSALPASVTPGGGQNAVQYNNSNAFAGSEAVFSFNGTNVGIGTSNASGGSLEVVKPAAGNALAVSSTATSNGNYLVVLNNGNVGISTVNPIASLDVLGGNKFTINSAGNVSIGTTGNSVSLTVGSGNVDIGTVSTFSNRLAVYGAVQIPAVFTGSNSSTSFTSGEAILISNTDGSDGTSAGIQFGSTHGGSRQSSIKSIVTGTGVGDILMGASRETLRLLAAGNLGIGTSSPGSLLGVLGGISSGSYATTTAPSGGIISSGNVGIGTTTPPQQLYVANTGEFQAIKIHGGESSSRVLVSNSVGVGTWMDASTLAIPGTGGPGGSAFQLQYNNSGSLGGITNTQTNGTNVGIGTSSIVNRFNVGGNVGISTLANSSYLSTNLTGATAMAVDGNVGIGTFSSTQMLTVSSGLNDVGMDINSYGATTSTFTASYLVVAGGGGSSAGAGGAGGMLTGSESLTNGQAYSVTVGAGGTTGNPGSNSVFNGHTSTGGGAGDGTGGNQNGGSGASVGSSAGGTGIVGQGHNGGTSSSSGGRGGGGGANAVGADQPGANQGGNGGAGTSSSITGASVCYAGGGGGGASSSPGTATCGGGNGTTTTGIAGTDGTGGGAGGGWNVAGNAGGKGIVIISYTTPVGGDGTGGTITHSGGNTIHSFTSSGTFNAPSTSPAAPRIKFQIAQSSLFTVGVQGSDANKFKISTSALGTNDRMIIDANGNVGIGTSSPLALMSVWGGNVGIGTFTADGGSLIVGSNNVGIGTPWPGQVLDVNGNVHAGAGTITTPTFAFIGNRNTGIYNPSSNQIGLVNNGTERVRIDALGNIGLATTTPQDRLIVTSGNVGLGTWTAAGGNLIVRGNGNVGIYSAWPGKALDVGVGTVRAFDVVVTTGATDGSIVCWCPDKSLGVCTTLVGVACTACTCH